MLRFALLSTIVSTSCRETEARGHDVSAVPCDINSATLVPTSLCNFQFQSALVCIRRATRPGLSRSTCTPVCLTKALEPRPGTKALEPSHETMYATPRRVDLLATGHGKAVDSNAGILHQGALGHEHGYMQERSPASGARSTNRTCRGYTYI